MSALIVRELKIVAYVCDVNGRHPDIEKVKKVLDWLPCKSVTEAKAFIGLCVYYRIWIKDFTHIADPIFATFRKKKSKRGKKHGGKEDEKGKSEGKEEEKEFVWGAEQEMAMSRLKQALVSPPALQPIVYTPEPGKNLGRIVLSIDASLLGFGAILQQEDEHGRRHPSRYESRLWTETERKYD